MLDCDYCHPTSPATVAKINPDGTRTNCCDTHDRRCVGCDFYAALPGETGECRRNPPVLVMLGDELRSAFPDVPDPEKMWCGEFKRRPGT